MMIVRAAAVKNNIDIMDDTFIEELQQRLLQFIRGRVANEADAEDILQDSFQAMHRNIDSLQNSSRLESWVFQIVRNKIIDYYRKPKRQQTDIDYVEIVDGEEEVLGDSLAPCVHHMMTCLSQDDQDILKAVDLEGQAVKTYAEHSELTESACKSRVQRARKKLRDLFHSCCGVKTLGGVALAAEHETACTICGPTCQCS